MENREQWGSRIGLILAMAGNAVGLGNFLRFPVKAAQNGGGAFMIPYFVAFVLLAIPLMWIEWSIGRHGGKYRHGSLPGMFDSMWQHPISKYLGVFGLFVSTIIVIYYTYIESWTLGFSFFSLTGEYFGINDMSHMKGFLTSYQGVSEGYFSDILPAYIFLLITMALNFYVLGKGITKGIEKFAKIAMPLLLFFGLFLAIWVFTIGTPDPAHPENSVWSGFAFIWNPNFTELGNSKIWLEAAGQVFFTLSVGMGTLHAYASYLRRDNDIALSGLSTAALNEFVEIVIGASIAIPIAVAFFGVDMTKVIAQAGSYDLGFVSMPIIFKQIPMGKIIGFMWFFLLFFAGITSSVAMAQPLISFLKEQFNFSHKKATIWIGSLIFFSVHLVVFFLKF
jgi:SNF family Na+-dependent transporter